MNYVEHDDEFYHYRVYLRYYADYDDRDFDDHFCATCCGTLDQRVVKEKK